MDGNVMLQSGGAAIQPEELNLAAKCRDLTSDVSHVRFDCRDAEASVQTDNPQAPAEQVATPLRLGGATDRPNSPEGRSDNDEVAGIINKLADSATAFISAIDQLARQGEGWRISVQKHLDTLTGRFDQLAEVVADQKALGLALQQDYRQLSSEVVAVQGMCARRESDVEVLRGEIRQHSELTGRQLEELAAQLELHQQEYSRLKSIVSELGSRMAVWCERMDRQGDVLRSLCELQAQRMATVEQVLSSFAGIR